MVTYSLSLVLKGITSISSTFNPYLMYFFSSLAEVIGYISCYLNDRFSRKKVMIGFLGTASLVCKDNFLLNITRNDRILINYMFLVCKGMFSSSRHTERQYFRFNMGLCVYYCFRFVRQSSSVGGIQQRIRIDIKILSNECSLNACSNSFEYF